MPYLVLRLRGNRLTTNIGAELKNGCLASRIYIASDGLCDARSAEYVSAPARLSPFNYVNVNY